VGRSSAALSPSSFSTNTNTSPLSTNTSTTPPLMIAVEGNIASGKSTFLELLSKQHHVAIFPEPVARWTDVGGTNLFRDMMEDGPRWMHAFQFFSSLTRVEIAYQAAKAPASISIMERSLFSERYCFVQMMAEAGSLTQGEFTILNRWFKMLTGRGDPSLELDLIVYIEAEPEVLMQRIRGRGRGGEETLARWVRVPPMRKVQGARCKVQGAANVQGSTWTRFTLGTRPGWMRELSPCLLQWCASMVTGICPISRRRSRDLQQPFPPCSKPSTPCRQTFN